MKLCKHCGVRKANRPRGLCWGCYHSPARVLYPGGGDATRGGVGFRDCPGCGGKISTAMSDQRVCSTCCRPASEQAGYFRRIARYAALVEAGRRIFEGDAA